MNDANWACLISKPEKVKEFSNTDLVYYHGIVAQAYLNDSRMLPGGYRSAVKKLYLEIGEELMRRLGSAERKQSA